MSEPVRILTVCTGNVCRSPYLERRLQQSLDAAWGSGAVEVRSAGTGALVGSGMHPESLALLAARGVEGDDFVARQVAPAILADQQLVITAAREHRGAVARMFPKGLARTHALLDLAQLARQVGDDELPDHTDAASWFSVVVPLLAAKRGLQLPLEPEQADVVDPIGRPHEVFELMQQQIEDALHDVLRVLGC